MTHLIQEGEQEVSGGSVIGEEAADCFVEHQRVEAAAGGGQGSQRSQHEARLLARHGLLDLLHVLLDV